MTTYVKIVKGATKIKVAAPKPKYIEPILIGTHEREKFNAIINALSDRLGDTAWSIVFKSLLVLHIMIREGEQDVTLKYLAKNPRFLDLPQIKTIRSGDAKSLLRYAKYLTVRARQFGSTGIDYVRDEQENGSHKEGARLRRLTIDKGLLREVESVEKQISFLLNCKFNESDVNNDVVLTCFRMLVNDLLCLFQSLNEGVINILEHYFEMSKYDAERALEIYKDFVVLTTDVINYLRVAKHLEYATKLHVPTIKHAPTALAKSLEEYLHDEHFEANRSQYLAEKDYKGKSPIKPTSKKQETSVNNPWKNQIQPLQVQFTQQQQPQVQPETSVSQPSLAPIQHQPTYNPFLQQQQATFVQPQVQQTFTGIPIQPLSNPMILPQQTSTLINAPQQNANMLVLQQTSNPFLQQAQTQQQQQPQLQSQQSQTQGPSPQPLKASQTGNNPFSLEYKESTAKNVNNPFAERNTITTQATGTNPFQSQIGTNSTGANSFSFGGYEKLPTVAVFPQTIQEQRTEQFNANAGLQLQHQVDLNRQQQQQQQQQQLNNGYLNNQFTGFQQQQQFPQNQQFQPIQQQHTFQSNGYQGPSLI